MKKRKNEYEPQMKFKFGDLDDDIYLNTTLFEEPKKQVNEDTVKCKVIQKHELKNGKSKSKLF